MMQKSVGTQLRDGRELKHLSLEDLEALTGIKASYLLAMEMDQFSLLPSKSYEISYLKRYAQAIDLDHEDILRHYHIAVAEKQERTHAKQLEPLVEAREVKTYSRLLATTKPTSHRRLSRMMLLSSKGIGCLLPVMLVAILGIMGLWIFWQSSLRTVVNEPTTRLESKAVNSPTTSPSSESPSLSVTPSADGINLTAQLTKAKKPVDLVLTLSEGVVSNWFSVSQSHYDAGANLNQEIPVTRVVLAEDVTQTVIALGNTSGVSIEVNGQDLDLSTLLPNTSGYITLTIE